jgi:hypothetical protein
MLREGTNISDVPTEILSDILARVVSANKRDGVHFTYGLSESSHSFAEPHSPKLTRYVRSPLRDELMTLDAAWAVRRVCQQWGGLVMSQIFREIREQCSPGRDRWADLTPCRSRYPLYELIENPRGTTVQRDPQDSLRKTHALLLDYPVISRHVRRLWFDGFHAASTDEWIISIVQSCPNLESLTIPWTVLRRGSAEDWIEMLKTATSTGKALRSLEIRSTRLNADDEYSLGHSVVTNPLGDSRVNFRGLHRLRLSGDAEQVAIADGDLVAISKSAINLESIQVTGSSTISTLGVLALANASRSHVRFLEYRPVPHAIRRSQSHCHTNRDYIAGNPFHWISNWEPSIGETSGSPMDSDTHDFSLPGTPPQDAVDTKTKLWTPGSPRLKAVLDTTDPSSTVCELFMPSMETSYKAKSPIARHLCENLSALPNLREIDISLPSVCAGLFAHGKMSWSGSCLIRFSTFCHMSQCDTPRDQSRLLRQTLEAARSLMVDRRRLKSDLTIELIKGSYVFRPDKELVYGDFSSEMRTRKDDESEQNRVLTIMTGEEMMRHTGSGHIAVGETYFLEAVGDGRFEF